MPRRARCQKIARTPSSRNVGMVVGTRQLDYFAARVLSSFGNTPGVGVDCAFARSVGWPASSFPSVVRRAPSQQIAVAARAPMPARPQDTRHTARVTTPLTTPRFCDLGRRRAPCVRTAPCGLQVDDEQQEGPEDDEFGYAEHFGRVAALTGRPRAHCRIDLQKLPEPAPNALHRTARLRGRPDLESVSPDPASQ